MTLAEIEAKVEGLSSEEKQELMLFLAARLRAQTGPLPQPRRFNPEQIKAWISQDEREMQELRDSASR